MNKSFLLFALTALPLVGFAQIDTTKLNEIIIAENRLQTPFSKIVRNIQLITKEEIAAMPAKSINEVLSFVGGVDLRQRGPFGTQADVSLDGGSFEQVLILINGMKVSDAQTAHHSLNIPIPLSAIERIEIIKGPAARIYGINALTGAINIITKANDKSSLTINTQMGSAFKNKALADGTGIYGGGSLQALLNLGSEKTQQLLSFGTDNYNGQRYNSATNDKKIFYQGNFNLNATNTLNMMGGYIYNAFGANGYYAAPIDKEAFEIVKTALVEVSTKNQINNNISISPRLSSRYNWDDYRFYRNNLSIARSQHRTAVWSAELNGNIHSALGDIGLGLESRSENIHSTNIGLRQRYNHGFYAEYKADIQDRLLFNTGVYINYNTQYGWQAFPGLDAAYLLSKDWKFNFNIGSSQRIPSFTDLYLKQTGNIGNPNLKSENAWQYELTLQYQNQNIQTQIGYFSRSIDNFIDWIRSSNSVPYQSQNFGNNKIQGFQLGIKQKISIQKTSSFNYDLTYHYLSADKLNYPNGITSKYVLENLKNQLIAKLSFNSKKWIFELNNRWLERNKKKDYLITDLRLKYQEQNWAIYADVNNIADTKYIEVAAVPLPSRWFALGAQYRINW